MIKTILAIVLFLLITTTNYSQSENKVTNPKEKQKSIELIGSLSIISLHFIINSLNISLTLLDNKSNLDQVQIDLNKLSSTIDYLKKDFKSFKSEVSLGNEDNLFIDKVLKTIDFIKESIILQIDWAKDINNQDKKAIAINILSQTQKSFDSILKGE